MRRGTSSRAVGHPHLRRPRPGVPVGFVSTPSTPCSFTGGTLHGVKQGRMLMGFAPPTIMEPIYEAVGKDADCFYKNIVARQIYVRDSGRDLGTTLGYILDRIEGKP